MLADGKERGRRQSPNGKASVRFQPGRTQKTLQGFPQFSGKIPSRVGGCRLHCLTVMEIGFCDQTSKGTALTLEFKCKSRPFAGQPETRGEGAPRARVTGHRDCDLPLEYEWSSVTTIRIPITEDLAHATYVTFIIGNPGNSPARYCHLHFTNQQLSLGDVMRMMWNDPENK